MLDPPLAEEPVPAPIKACYLLLHQKCGEILAFSLDGTREQQQAEMTWSEQVFPDYYVKRGMRHGLHKMSMRS